MSAQSYQNLKRQVVELVAVNEALSEKLAAFVADHEANVAELTETIQVTEQERDQLRSWYHEERKKVEGAFAEAKEAHSKRDDYRLQFESDRDLRRDAERERDLARAHAEAMRRVAYPEQPQFPWEVVATQAGPFDPMTGLWRGN
jgi:hypothetical protein